MKENHILQRDDLASRRLKKNQKVAKRSLAFTTGTEEFLPETGKEFSEVSSSVETSVGKRNITFTTFTTGTEELSSDAGKELSEVSPSKETSEADSSITKFTSPVSLEAYSDLKISTNSVDFFNKHCIFNKTDGSVEVDIASSFLKKVRDQVVNSSNVDEQSKKLVSALVTILDECFALSDEKDFFTEIVSARGRILFLCILLWIFTLSMIFFYCSESNRSQYGPLPT